MIEQDIKKVFDELASLVFAYETLTDSDKAIYNHGAIEPGHAALFRQLNIRFRNLLDDAVTAGGLD